MSEEAGTVTAESAVEVAAETAPKVEPKPTRDELREKGWSKEELDSAEKHEMTAKADEKKAATPKVDAEAPKTDEKNRRAEDKPKNTWPDMKDLSEEQLKVLSDAFPKGNPQWGLIERLKTERRMRQEERAKATQYEARIKELEARTAVQPVKETDEAGNEIDPLDKPLTRRELQQIEEERQEEYRKQQGEMTEKQQRIADILEEQETIARTANPEFDRSLQLATEIKQKGASLITDPTAQKFVMKLFADLRHAGLHADELTENDLTAAELTEEIAKLHPLYGKAANGSKAETHDGKSKPDTKVNGDFTPDQMERMKTNTQRRASSASVSGGGGSRTVSAEDVTLADLNKMSSEKRRAFREKHPDVMGRLLRG